MSNFHRASLEMSRLRLCRITNESTEIENCYSGLNRELLWLWNSVYDFFAEIQNYSIFSGLNFFASSFRVTEED